MLNHAGDIAATFILVAAFAIILGFKEARQCKTFVFVTWFVISLHVLVAIINRYFFTVIGADSDAVRFYTAAEYFATTKEWVLGFDAVIYEQLLGITYVIFGYSQLLAESLSVFAFSISCVVLLKILLLLQLDKYKSSVMLLYGALPSMVLFGSVTLREPFQILFFMLAVYYGLNFYSKEKFFALFASLLSCCLMALFHKGLVFYAIFFCLVVTLWPKALPKNNQISKINSTNTLPLIISIIGVSFFVYLFSYIGGAGILRNTFSSSVVDYINEYRLIQAETRAHYGLILDNSSMINLFLSGCKIYIHYMFSPFPWQVSNIIDVYAMSENILRLLLILFSIKAFLAASSNKKYLYGFLLTLYFSMTVLWALGTSNYGTAIRHHIVNYWIIVLIGLPSFLSFAMRAIYKYKRIFKTVES